MKHVKKALTMVLVLCMMVTLIPSTVFANDTTVEANEQEISEDTTENESTEIPSVEKTSITKEKSKPLDTTNLYKIYHLDCGRKYFSVAQVKELIDVIAKNDYNTLELAIGNDGLRFLLNDMSVTANGTTYSSDDVTAAIKAGNETYYDAGENNEWTESEMNEIIAYAKGKGIAIIPLINTPGHMDAILNAATKVTGENCAFGDSKRTIDVTNETAVNFTLTLVNKYIQYFAGNGSTIFNMGCDEYANDVSGGMGFGQLIVNEQYGSFINYVNQMAAQVQNAGMTPMAFNDGIYYDSAATFGIFDPNIVISYWSSGWNGYNVSSATFLADKGHKIINTNGVWYYILGKEKDEIDRVEMPHIDAVKKRIESNQYNSVMGSGTMNVAGSMLCSWCDDPTKDYSETEKANFKTQIATFASKNTDVFNVKNDEPEYKTQLVELDPGETFTKDISGVNYAGDYKAEDPTVATVTVTGNDQMPSNPIYTSETPTYNDLISEDASEWMKTNYYYKVENNYYPIYAKRSTKTNWLGATYCYYFSYLTTDLNYVSIGKSFDNIYRPSWQKPDISNIYLQTGSGDPTSASTTITIIADENAAGKTTTVTIGDTIYTIKVKTPDLSSITKNLEYWITNGRSKDQDENICATVMAENVNSVDGLNVTEIAPTNTTKEGRTLQYWRCRLLDKNKTNNSASGTEEQKDVDGDDETYSGFEFTRIRYWNGAWAVYTENNEWVDVLSNHQLIAYYLEILPVADELIVTAADWGKKGDGTTSGDYLEPNNSCTVSVQVVYPDGTTNPKDTTADSLKSRTIAYGYWNSGRGIGTLNLEGLEGYQIWQITAETGEESTNSTGNFDSFTVTDFIWDNNPMTVYNGDPVDSYVIHNDAHNPSKDSYYKNLVWDENHEAILIKVYVKPKPTDDTLKVVYYDEKFGAELYQYGINVKNGVNFENITPEPSEFNGNADRIDVTGCSIKNNFEVDQKFETDLTKVPEAQGKYSSELYKYTGSVISEDNKTLYLYYTINTDVLSPMFVIDYGRPFTFELSDVVKDGIATVKSVSVVEKTKYGTLSYDENTKQFTYTPTKVLKGIDVLSINILFDGQTVASTTNSGVMPATTVNYEEGFAELTGFANEQVDNIYQTKQIAGKSTDNYGYDVNVLSKGNNAAYANSKGSKAVFQFTGTGVDLYVNSKDATGKIAVQVRDTDNKLVKVALIDTTSYSEITGNFSNRDQNDLIAASIRGLNHGEYTVKVTASEDKDVYFDGFRVYGTIANQGDSYYIADEEDNPTFLELRDYVLTAMEVDNSTSSAAVYAQVREKTDGQLTGVVLANNPKYSAEDLLKNGPKNELFLLPGESVAFVINTDREVQLGMKAVNGTAIVDGTYKGTISSDKDMFYTVKEKNAENKIITITNKSNSTSILSITKVKICDDPNVTFGELGENDFNDALVSLGVIEEEPTAVDATLNINVVDVYGKNVANASLVRTGNEGEVAEFAATDIIGAVNNVMPNGYGIANEGNIANVTVTYGEDGEVNVVVGKIATLTVTYKKMFGRNISTVTLTKVQTDTSSKARFTAEEIRAAAPKGYFATNLFSSNVRYGYSSSRTVIVL